MGWKGVGLRVLRWVLWLFVGLMFVRGVFTTFGPAPSAEPTQAVSRTPALAERVEPAGLRSFPALFAVEYLTFRPGQPEERANRLKPFLASGQDPQAGWAPGKGRTGQTAEGAWVHGIRPVSGDRWLVTVAVRVSPYEEVAASAAVPQAQGTPAAPALTAPERLVRRPLSTMTLYLAVPVTDAAGGWVVYDYPALVPAPAAGQLQGSRLDGTEVADKDDKIKTLAASFFRTYFSGGADLSYYLAPGTRIPAAPSAWQFDGVPGVLIADAGGVRRALADVQVTDPGTGARYTFRYHLQLVERDSRWYIQDMLQKGE